MFSGHVCPPLPALRNDLAMVSFTPWGVQIGAFSPKIHNMGPHLSSFPTSFRDTPGLISISSSSSSSWSQAEGPQGTLSGSDSFLCSSYIQSVKLDSRSLAPTCPPTPTALRFPTERRSLRPGRSVGVENWPNVPTAAKDPALMFCSTSPLHLVQQLSQVPTHYFHENSDFQKPNVN